jgi:hypothetical protein
MDGTDTDKSSIDNVIIDYLSKKSVTDQTEKLALARIASKTQTNIDQVQRSINRLSTRNVIRKIFFQGKIGFELTPKEKIAIDAIAKVQTDRITKQLQEAIQRERKTKLRTSVLNKLISIEDKWQNYMVVDKKLADEFEKKATKLLNETKETQNKQPLCAVHPQNYDREFSEYKPQIENLTQQNNNLTKEVNNYAKIKNHLLSISADIEKIDKAIIKYESVAEATNQVRLLKTTLSKLEPIKSQLEEFDSEQLSRFEDLKTKLADNSRLLETLKKPTHEFAPIKRENSVEKTVLYPDPECPIKHEHKTSSYPIEEKCSKCGTKRKSTPVNIG